MPQAPQASDDGVLGIGIGHGILHNLQRKSTTLSAANRSSILTMASGPQLRVLNDNVDSSTSTYASTVLVVSDFENASLEAWTGDDKSSWLVSHLPSMLSSPQVLTFVPGSVGSAFTFTQLIDWGDALLDQMLAYVAQNPQITQRPLFWFGHGFGGFLLKRALGVLHERFFDPIYRGLIGATTGVVLLGVPSPDGNSPFDLQKVLSLLKSLAKQSSKTLQSMQRHVAITANISQKFSNANIEAPLLSIYETKHSRIGRSILAVRQILVDSALCETLTKRERLLGLNSTHDELCQLSPTLEMELKQFFGLALQLRSFEISLRSSTGTSLKSTVRDHVFSGIDGKATSDWEVQSPTGATTGSSDNDFVFLRQKSSSSSFARQSIKLPWYMLGPHARNDDFRGREDVLNLLDKHLLPTKGKPPVGQESRLRTFALCGLGGLGKTSIAVEFMHSRKTQYDAIFWIHAASGEHLASSFMQIAIGLGLEAEDKIKDQVVARNLVLQWFSSSLEDRGAAMRSTQDLSMDNTKWLIVFDGADNLAALRDYWPVSGSGSILVTSRDPLAKTQTYFLSPVGIDLQPFSTMETATWLRALTRTSGVPEDVHFSEEIADKIGNLPLAVPQIAGAINRRQLSLAEFLEAYALEAFRETVYRDTTGTVQNVALWTTFAFQELSAGSHAVLDVMSFFDAKAIPEHFFTTFAASPARKMPLKDLPSSSLTFVDARSELIGSSLLSRSIDDRTLKVHSLVQEAAMRTMSSDRMTAAFECALLMLRNAWQFGNLDYNPVRRKVCEPLLPHISHLLYQYTTNQSLQNVDTFNHDFGNLLVHAASSVWQFRRHGPWLTMSRLHFERYAIQSCCTMSEMAQSVLQSCSTLDYRLLAGSHAMRGVAACMTGLRSVGMREALKSIEYAEQVDWSQVPKEQWHERPYVHHNLGEIYMLSGDFAKAIACEDRAISMNQEGYTGPGKINTWSIWAMCNKALCLRLSNEASKLAEASQAMEDCLETQFLLFGTDDVTSAKTGLILKELGTIRVAQGRSEEAMDYYERCLRQFHATRGSIHFQVASTKVMVADLHFAKRDLGTTKNMLLEALQCYSTLDRMAAEITYVTLYLAKVVALLGDPETAEYRRAAEHEMLELSVKVGRNLRPVDVHDCQHYWALMPGGAQRLEEEVSPEVVAAGAAAPPTMTLELPMRRKVQEGTPQSDALIEIAEHSAERSGG